MQNPRNGKTLQRLLGAILLLVLGKIGFYFLFQGGRDLSAKRQDYVASTIVQQGDNLRIGAQAMMAGGVDLAAITFDTHTGTGIYNPAIGLSEHEAPPDDAFIHEAGPHVWIKKDTVRLQMNDLAGADHVAVLPGLRQNICGEIDRLLRQNSDRSIPRTAVTDATLKAWSSAATPIDFSHDAAHATRSQAEACIETSDHAYVYYVTLASP